MKDNIARRLGLYLAVAVLSASLEAASTVDLGTSGNAAHFKITGAGATAATAKQVGSDISIDSIGNGTGTFITGGSLGAFDGYWFADEQFLVPAGATNVSLTFSALSADDRVVLELNGSIIADFGLQSGTTNSYVGPGFMKLTDPGSDAAYTFTGVTSGTVIVGLQTGVNTLRLIVNNTNGGATGSTQTFVPSNGDKTSAALVATLSYTPPFMEMNDIVTVGAIGPVGTAHFGVYLIKPDGTRSVISDFANINQGLKVGSSGGIDVKSNGQIFLGAYNGNFPGIACPVNTGCLMTVDLQGNRSQYVSFDINQFHTPHDLSFDANGNIIVPDGNGTTLTGGRYVLKVFSDATYGVTSDFSTLRGEPWGVAILPDSLADQLALPHGSFLIVDNLAGTICRPDIDNVDGCGAVYAVRPDGTRQLLADLGDSKGDFGWNPETGVIEPAGTLLVGDEFAGCPNGGGCPALIRVNLLTGTHTMLTRGSTPTVSTSFGIHPQLGIVAACPGVATSLAANLCTVDPTTGAVTTLSDFSDLTQGQTGQAVSNPGAGQFLRVVPMLFIPPALITNPFSQTTCDGASVTFTAAANGAPVPSVQWQVSTDNGLTFTDIGGATSTTLTFTAAAAQDGNQFHAVFTNSSGSITTGAAILTVNTAPIVATNPTSQTVGDGSMVTFTAGANSKPTATVQWQVSTNSGATFTDIAGATSVTLSFIANSSENGYQYRAVFIDPCGTATTTAATLTVNGSPAMTLQPVNQTTCAGSSVTFTAAASGSPAPTVQWQVSTNGGATFTGIAGATSTTLTFTAAAGQDGNQFQAVFTNASGSATSNAATLTVNTAPTVTTNPLSQTVTAGGMVTFTAAASGKPSPTVQWQVSTDGGGTFANIAGATSTTLSFTSLSSQNGYQYRAVFTDLCGSANTTAAILTVNTPPSIATSPKNQAVCAGTSATFTASASGTPAPTVQWQVSTDNGATFTNIAGATSTTLTFSATASQDGNQFRGVFTNVAGNATTGAAILTVNTAPVITLNPTNQSVLNGATATFTAAASGKPTPTVQWQVSSDGGATFTNLAGATSTTLSFTASTAQNGNQYRAVFTDLCGSASSLAATLTVTSAAVPDLTITKSHKGNFRQQDIGDKYTIVVKNVGSLPTTGVVTVLDTLPVGLKATGMSGLGWTCTLATLTCTRSDAPGPGGAYPGITIIADVAANAPASVTNTATVSGGGENNLANDTANDVTKISKHP